MTETQQRYAQIEKECLAIQFGLKRFHQYVYGQRVVVETDHMPLLGIIKKPIPQISPRLQRMRLRIDPCDYDIVYRPGSELVLADTLSRASLSDNDIDVNDNEYVNTVYVESTTQSCRKELCELTEQDESFILVNPERSFGGTNGEKRSEASQLWKGGPPPENLKNLHGKWCNLRYS